MRRRQGDLTTELARRQGGFGLGQVPSHLAPDATATSICGYCSVGCSLDIHLREGEAVNLSPTASHPVNRGAACPKGWEALTPLRAHDRAVAPLLRSDRGRLEPVGWEEAIAAFVDRARAVQATHGPEAMAFLSTGQIPTEEMALLGALAKFGMGMVHGDGNTRQCMATAVVAYKQSFGFDAPPYTYADLELSDVIMLVGSNMCIAHPVLWQRVCRNPHRPEIVVIDPRATETAMAATQHCALAPKSDLTLLYGLARALIDRGAVDRAYVEAHTAGFEGFAAHVAPYTLERVGTATGLAPAAFQRLADTVAGGRRVSFWWTMGVNQSHEGTRVAQAIINLALMTGNIGRPGTGANSLTGQCNAMGSRLFSNTTNLFGGRDFTNAGHRTEVASRLGMDAALIPDRPSWAYDQIVEGIHTGAIKGLWVIATNSAHSWINHSDLHDLLARLDLLVVQDMYATTETATRAHIVLPAAGWGEKEGTFINSERRFGVIRRVARAPGQALADFSIFRLIAEAWGCASLLDEWRSPEAVFGVLRRLSAGQACDFSGIEGYRMIDEHGGIQWPYPEESPSGPPSSPTLPPSMTLPRSDPLLGGPARQGRGDPERRLFEDGRFFHPDGRARFYFDDPAPPRERPSERYPLVLLTGRGSSAQWHTQTRTAKSAMLRSLAPSTPYVEISPQDAGPLGVGDQDWVVVTSPRGSMQARAFVGPTVRPGQVFVPMHDPQVNRLTHPSFDPHSRQPSYKHCAVSVRALEAWER